jgi:hypothetical protein
MQFKAFEPGIEVGGESLKAIVEGFRKYPSIIMKYLTKYGFTKSADGKLSDIDTSANAWYPQQSWLDAFEGITKEIGVNSLYAIGRSIPENAVFPPFVNDIYSGIASLDSAYHMNHRKNGKVMFDPQTGLMLDGIGHYGFQPVEGENKIISVCENPYACDFDRGIIAAMATRFVADAKTVHDPDAPCRKKGADSCTYIVWW